MDLRGTPNFKLTYTVTLTATTLTTKLTIKNPSATAWDFTTLLHTYFAVANIKSAAVTGLTGTTFNDKVDPPATATSAKPTESRRGVTVAGEVDRVYEGVENDHVAVTGTGIGGGAVVVYKNGFPDVVVWNPWTDKAKAMADFGDEEYNNMICVEVGSVADMISLAGGATWEGSQTLVAI
ncbi:hypothetical protein HKX48_008884 [Thoreauomyces humboldtii]|nr:hypothetical protein HKX48_008884 [Thoreauomyces humboldtii]